MPSQATCAALHGSVAVRPWKFFPESAHRHARQLWLRLRVRARSVNGMERSGAGQAQQLHAERGNVRSQSLALTPHAEAAQQVHAERGNVRSLAQPGPPRHGCLRRLSVAARAQTDIACSRVVMCRAIFTASWLRTDSPELLTRGRQPTPTCVAEAGSAAQFGNGAGTGGRGAPSPRAGLRLGVGTTGSGRARVRDRSVPLASPRFARRRLDWLERSDVI